VGPTRSRPHLEPYLEAGAPPEVLQGRSELVGPALRAALVAAADAWLTALLGETAPGVALVATGAYGRGEPAPGSDLDLMLLHNRPSGLVAPLAERLWRPIWDAGLRLDHSVRTVEEALEVARADLKTALGLLDTRHVAGDAALTQALRERMLERWRASARRRLSELREACLRRAEHYGELAFLLEPDLKEARGGLRDGHAVRAVAATWVASGLDHRARSAYDLLLDTREALHLVQWERAGGLRGRAVNRAPSDRLGLEDQEAVAVRLGHPDPDALMRAVHQAGRTLAWKLDQTWRRVDSWHSGPAVRRWRRPVRRELADGVVDHGGEVLLTAGADLEARPWLALEAAGAAATARLPLAPQTLRRLEDQVVAPAEPWPPRAREALIALLGAGPGLVDVLEALDQVGVLERLLPEWQRVRCKPQRNPFHRWTVDRHLVETAVQASGLVRRVDRPDLLLLVAFLHDVGKGWPGNHSAAGAGVAWAVASRLGLGAADRSVLVRLVRHHLLLTDTATRRDLRDPATARAVAEAVGDARTLGLLEALTEADARATGPTAWTPWKARLVEELTRRVGERLDEEAPETGADPGGLSALARRALARPHRAELALEVDGEEIAVAAPARRGLLWRVAGVLALHRLDVRAATASTLEGTTLLTLEAHPRHGREPNWHLLRDDLRRALEDQLPLDRRLSEREAAYRQPAPLRPPPRLLFEDGASELATVVEVRCADGPAVLYRITRALDACGVEVRSARIATYGAEVVDAFYVVGPDGHLLRDAKRRASLVAEVLSTLQ
jgi:[protein-PII] uridylyltransferase